MTTKSLVTAWFEIWERGDYQDLPLAQDFKHTSPYGVINGKNAYLSLVKENTNLFLDNRFEIHDAMYEKDRACIRYTMISPTSSMEVSEWIYVADDKITEIVAYYNTAEERKSGRGLVIE